MRATALAESQAAEDEQAPADSPVDEVRAAAEAVFDPALSDIDGPRQGATEQ